MISRFLLHGDGKVEVSAHGDPRPLLPKKKRKRVELLRRIREGVILTIESFERGEVDGFDALRLRDVLKMIDEYTALKAKS